MSRAGLSMELVKVAMTSKPMKLNRMIERYVSESRLERLGRNVEMLMSLANPCVAANQMPAMATTAVMNILMAAPPFMIHSASEMGEKARIVTPHTKASSMMMATGSENSTPQSALMMDGNMQARLAIHSGKFTQ